MTTPVRTVQQLTLTHHPARHVAHQRHHRHRWLDITRRRLDAVQHRLHQHTVKRMTRHQTTTSHPCISAPPLQRLHPRNQPAHHSVRPVVRRYLHTLRSTLLNQRLHSLRRGKHRRHRSRIRRKTPHQLPTHRRQPQPLLQPEHPRHMRRRQLPTLCPNTATGRTPTLSHSADNAHPNAYSAGCVHVVSSRLPRRTLTTEHHVEQRLAP